MRPKPSIQATGSSRRSFIRGTAAAAGAVTLGFPFISSVLWASDAKPTTTSTTPNILILVVDDLGWGDVSFHKSALATPNLRPPRERRSRTRAFLRLSGLQSDSRSADHRPDAEAIWHRGAPGPAPAGTAGGPSDLAPRFPGSRLSDLAHREVAPRHCMSADQKRLRPFLWFHGAGSGLLQAHQSTRRC